MKLTEAVRTHAHVLRDLNGNKKLCDNWQAILNDLKEHPGKPEEVAMRTGLRVTSVQSAIQRMHKEGLVELIHYWKVCEE